MLALLSRLWATRGGRRGGCRASTVGANYNELNSIPHRHDQAREGDDQASFRKVTQPLNWRHRRVHCARVFLHLQRPQNYTRKRPQRVGRLPLCQKQLTLPINKRHQPTSCQLLPRQLWQHYIRGRTHTKRLKTRQLQQPQVHRHEVHLTQALRRRSTSNTSGKRPHELLPPRGARPQLVKQAPNSDSLQVNCIRRMPLNRQPLH